MVNPYRFLDTLISILFISVLLVLSFISCTNPKENNIKKYLFIGHSYSWKSPEGNRIDSRLEALDKDEYDQIWLGGDICSATTLKKSTLSYLDRHLNISNPNTLWAVGNHDIRNGNLQFIRNTTGRPLYYTQHKDGITIMVLNTVTTYPVYEDSCQYMKKQFQMISNVLDTISNSTHLVLLMHNVVWSNAEKDMNAVKYANAWAEGHKFLCQNSSKFTDLIYPVLKKVQKNGTQVIIVSGDGGQFEKKYEYTSPEGIRFYISGINNSHTGPTPSYSSKPFNKKPDSILVFKHNIIEKTLIAEFIELK